MTDFGAFVELDRVLMHYYISQIAKHHVEKPSDELKIGQEIEARLLISTKKKENQLKHESFTSG
ncbi:MAG: S1 RNA-binding domain-containing protein [Eubacterium ventriosum]